MTQVQRSPDEHDESDEPERVGGVREVKSAARTVELLELLASRQNRPSSLRELSDAMGVPRSSLYALLRTLVSRGWVSTDATGTLYRIGIRALHVGTSYLDTDPYLHVVQSCLNELGESIDETFHLGRLERFDIVYLATRESSQYLRPFSRVGRRLPAYATALGKSLLAHLHGAERDAHLPEDLVALTPHTLTSREELEVSLARTVADGYAVDHQENNMGVRCFAIPLGYSDPPHDAISSSVPLARLTDDREELIVTSLKRAGEKIERAVAPIVAAGAGLV